MKSDDDAELLPIGQVAERLGLRASTLRYYDERGLVSPRARLGGRRMYGPDELRRLAFLTIARRAGVPLETAVVMLDASGPHWRRTARDQIAALDQVIARAGGAKILLGNLLGCPQEHPAGECPAMIDALDRIAAGTSVDDLATEYM